MSMDTEALEEERLTLAFKPNQAKISTSFETRSHYNLVVHCGEIYTEELRALLSDLDAYPELFTSKLENCHMTVAIIEETTPIHNLHATVAQVLDDQPLQLHIKGMHIRTPGVFLNVYSPNVSLKNLRQKLASETGAPFDPDDRLANVGWITLARFINTPSKELVSYVQHRYMLDVGSIANATPVLHHSNNAMQLGETVWELRASDSSLEN